MGWWAGGEDGGREEVEGRARRWGGYGCPLEAVVATAGMMALPETHYVKEGEVGGRDDQIGEL